MAYGEGMIIDGESKINLLHYFLSLVPELEFEMIKETGQRNIGLKDCKK